LTIYTTSSVSSKLPSRRPRRSVTAA